MSKQSTTRQYTILALVIAAVCLANVLEARSGAVRLNFGPGTVAHVPLDRSPAIPDPTAVYR
jgi:hypothetical protein